jgi:hypothetical protein
LFSKRIISKQEGRIYNGCIGSTKSRSAFWSKKKKNWMDKKLQPIWKDQNISFSE